MTKEEAEELEREASTYDNYPIVDSVSRKGWEGVMRASHIAAPILKIPWNEELIQLLANCLANYERFKEEFEEHKPDCALNQDAGETGSAGIGCTCGVDDD
jgi:hypothetical protein